MHQMTKAEIDDINLTVFKNAKSIRTSLTLGPTIALEESVFITAKEHIEALEAQHSIMIASLEAALDAMLSADGDYLSKSINSDLEDEIKIVQSALKKARGEPC